MGWRHIVEKMYSERHRGGLVREHGKHPVYAQSRKVVPLPSMAQPMTLRIPKNGRLVEWSPKPGPAAGIAQPGARV